MAATQCTSPLDISSPSLSLHPLSLFTLSLFTLSLPPPPPLPSPIHLCRMSCVCHCRLLSSAYMEASLGQRFAFASSSHYAPNVGRTMAARHTSMVCSFCALFSSGEGAGLPLCACSNQVNPLGTKSQTKPSPFSHFLALSLFYLFYIFSYLGYSARDLLAVCPALHYLPPWEWWRLTASQQFTVYYFQIKHNSLKNNSYLYFHYRPACFLALKE